MQRTNLESKNLQGANFKNADLQQANARYANLKGAILAFANLQEAELEFTNMQGVSLQNANMQRCWVGSADLREANLQNANLKEASLEDSYLRDAKKIESAKYDEKTRLPDAEYQRDADGRIIKDETTGYLLSAPQSYWKPETDMTRYTNPDHPDFWMPKWAAAGFASASEWYDTMDGLVPSRFLPGRSYPWWDAGYGNNHMAWVRDGNQDYQAKHVVADVGSHLENTGLSILRFAIDAPWREAGYGNDHMAWVRDGKPDPLTENDPYYEYRREWLAAGFENYLDWYRAGFPQPWREAGYGNDHIAWLSDDKPNPLPIEHPNSWRPQWQSAGFASLVEYVDADRPLPWYDAGYGYDHMAWLRAGKPDEKLKKE